MNGQQREHGKQNRVTEEANKSHILLTSHVGQ